MTDRVHIVMLRQPTSKVGEARTDPFYEFGSFGLTGCHSANIMSDKKASGGRIAFAQGGRGEVRLVLLTPPTEFEKVGDRMEARWKAVKPLRFDHAPILIRNDGTSDVPRVREFVESVNRPSWASRFGSRFRSRKEPLPPGIAEEIIAAWERARQLGGEVAIAKVYFETMPHAPPSPDIDRKAKYEELRGKALGVAPKKLKRHAASATARRRRSRLPSACVLRDTQVRARE
jgi:hypothetical protein